MAEENEDSPILARWPFPFPQRWNRLPTDHDQSRRSSSTPELGTHRALPKLQAVIHRGPAHEIN